MSKINPAYSSINGVWRVTTEGDEEGRSVKDLGVHTGFVDEIAAYLASNSFYSLHFTAVPPPQTGQRAYRKCPSVSVSFNIDSGTWPNKMDSAQRAKHFANLFRDRDVKITESCYYSSFTIHFPFTKEEIAASKEDARRQQILSNMSEEDRRLFTKE